MTEKSTTPKNAKWVERFGTLEAVIARTDKNGKPYATFVIAAAKFRQPGIAFGLTATKILETPIGSRMWAKGPMTFKTVQIEGEDKQVGDFTAIYFNAKAPKVETLAYEDVAAELLDAEFAHEETSARGDEIAIAESAPEAAPEASTEVAIEETALGAALRAAMVNLPGLKSGASSSSPVQCAAGADALPSR